MQTILFLWELSSTLSIDKYDLIVSVAQLAYYRACLLREECSKDYFLEKNNRESPIKIKKPANKLIYKIFSLFIIRSSSLLIFDLFHK